MEWFGDRHGGDLGTDLLGEEDALLYRRLIPLSQTALYVV
jgi:hypothetical protein